MRIYYDGNIFTLQSIGGVNRYFANIIDGLPSDWEASIGTCVRRECNFPARKGLKIFSYPRFGFWPGRLSYLFEKHYFRTVARHCRPRLFHPTFYTTLCQQEVLAKNIPTVVTVYDMVHERFPDITDRDNKIRESKKKMIEHADRLICISQFTQDELLHFYPEAQAKSVVIPLAQSLVPSSEVKDSVGRPYFIYVGSRWSYKNIDILYASFKKVAERYANVALCLVGPPISAQERRTIFELGLSDKIIDASWSDDRTLAALYRHSIALVYPSRYEGFGIPPLEAMACGTAVIAARAGSIPEIVGDAAVLCSSNDEAEYSSAMLRMIEDSSFKSKYVALGANRTNMFSWEKCVTNTIALYRSMAPNT